MPPTSSSVDDFPTDAEELEAAGFQMQKVDGISSFRALQIETKIIIKENTPPISMAPIGSLLVGKNPHTTIDDSKPYSLFVYLGQLHGAPIVYESTGIAQIDHARLSGTITNIEKIRDNLFEQRRLLHSWEKKRIEQIESQAQVTVDKIVVLRGALVRMALAPIDTSDGIYHCYSYDAKIENIATARLTLEEEKKVALIKTGADQSV